MDESPVVDVNGSSDYFHVAGDTKLTQNNPAIYGTIYTDTETDLA